MSHELFPFNFDEAKKRVLYQAKNMLPNIELTEEDCKAIAMFGLACYAEGHETGKKSNQQREAKP